MSRRGAQDEAMDDATGESTDASTDGHTALHDRLAELEWRYCLAMDEIRQLSDVVRADGDTIAALEARLERLERRQARAAAAGFDGAGDGGFGADYDSDVRDDWPESF